MVLHSGVGIATVAIVSSFPWGDDVCGGDPHQDCRLVGVRRLRRLLQRAARFFVVRFNRLLQEPLLFDVPDVCFLDGLVPVGLILCAEPATFVASAFHRCVLSWVLPCLNLYIYYT